MPTVDDVLKELESLGSEQIRKIFARHGAPRGQFGVKVGDLKTIAKKIKNDQSLALQLYASGNPDAMYLAGLVADGSQMSKRELETWAKQAPWQMISEYTVPWVASEHPAARELALKWMASKKPQIASTGWSTYGAMISTHPDESLDLDEIASLLDRVAETIHDAPNRVRYTMNGFVIAVGAFVKPLLGHAKRVAKQIGDVHVDMGETSCEVPNAAKYIQKIEAAKRVGKKRADARC